ncbi:MAG: hypothetical protein IPO92_15125 [Saprospiraceae bacterium]|nr:hypothetical protein [Saprospiraceae bacterium]
MNPHNRHVAGYIRYNEAVKIICLFNYSPHDAYLTWFAIKEKGLDMNIIMIDLISGDNLIIGQDHEYIKLKAYQVMVLQEA